MRSALLRHVLLCSAAAWLACAAGAVSAQSPPPPDAGTEAPPPDDATAQEPPEPSPLQRLAHDLAAGVARAAGTLRVELAPIDDRTARGGAWGLDLHALLAARLYDRLARPGEAPRVRVAAVLSQAGPRLIVAARVEEAPGGQLIDLVSASAEVDPSWLALVPSPRAPEARPVEVVSSSRTVPLDERVLDLAWADDERLLLLAPDSLALYRWMGTSLTLESRRPLPGPGGVVRAPGGLLLPAQRERAVWALTSGASQAALFGVEGGRLVERGLAEALPWPGAPRGVRFRPGTNLIEAALPGLGDGPLLGLEASWPAGAVSPAAELLLAGAEGARPTGVRVGPALAPLWKPLLAAASADPPGARDAILLLRQDGGGAGEAGRLSVDGAVRALGARAADGGARLVAAVEEPGGAFHLEVFDLRRPDAGAELP